MSDNVSMEMLQALVQRTLDEAAAGRREVAALRGRIDVLERRIGGRLTMLERRLTKQGTEVAEDLQGQIDELNERVEQLEKR